MAEARRCLAAGRLEAGLDALRGTAGRVEQSAAALVVRALLSLGLGQSAEALADAVRAQSLEPEGRDGYVVLARAQEDLGYPNRADRTLHAGIAVAPGDPTLWRLLSGRLQASAAPATALAAWRRAHALLPNDRRVRAGLVGALARLSAERRFAGDPDGALQAACEATALDPASAPAWSSRLFARLMLETTTPDSLHAESGAAGNAVARIVPASVPARPDARGPLRVGLLSTSLAQSSVRYFVEGLLAAADSRRIAFTLYDEPAASARPLDRPPGLAYVDASTFDGAALAGRIAADGTHVLIDLMGYGWYGRRLDVLGHRPAPHLVTAIGYPGTLGLPTLVHKLTDQFIHPPGGAERLYEAPLYLPHMHCYTPPLYAPAVAPRGGGRPVVFGSFNQLSKIGPTAVAAWRAALDAVPGARLLLKRADLRLTDRDALLSRLAAQGLPLDRVDFLDVADRHDEHLGAYAGIDVALDTFPYNGTTTTCEALWMGVPVVTLVGDRETSRTGLSLLHAAGLPDLAVRTIGAFAETASRLAADTVWRADWRGTARQRLRASALCDAAAYAEAFTAALEKLVIGEP